MSARLGRCAGGNRHRVFSGRQTAGHRYLHPIISSRINHACRGFSRTTGRWHKQDDTFFEGSAVEGYPPRDGRFGATSAARDHHEQA